VLAMLVFAVLRAKAGLAPRAREHFVQ